MKHCLTCQCEKPVSISRQCSATVKAGAYNKEHRCMKDAVAGPYCAWHLRVAMKKRKEKVCA